ncbi:Spo0B C-terminal domain-containing protein [Cytobacillus sp. FJAT-54145]|uniref:Spo0B C-terminal domain-containing protein n=1 Tax=Cytobacillus spartinae TaxID=3299023 RepID=A0ABW6KIR0_9BACI
MKKDWNTVEVLGHARHDWLNKLQLIKGNLSLNNIERAKAIIDEIVVEAGQQSKLSNLKIPQFASMLLTYNWENHSFQLEYEILDHSNISIPVINDQLLTEWTSSFFELLNASIKLYHENHLSITIEQQSEGTRFFFDFRGIITNKAPIMDFLNKKTSMLQVDIQELSEQELALEIFIPSNE